MKSGKHGGTGRTRPVDTEVQRFSREGNLKNDDKKRFCAAQSGGPHAKTSFTIRLSSPRERQPPSSLKQIGADRTLLRYGRAADPPPCSTGPGGGRQPGHG